MLLFVLFDITKIRLTRELSKIYAVYFAFILRYFRIT